MIKKNSEFSLLKMENYKAFFRFVIALPKYKNIDELLLFIIDKILELIEVEGTNILLVDEKTNEFFFRAASYAPYDEEEIKKRIKTIRFPADKGVTGHVFKTGKYLIENDVKKSRIFLKEVDEKAGFSTKSIIAVPIKIKDRVIGAIVLINCKNGNFTEKDAGLLRAVSGAIAYPIDNIRMNDALKESYDEVKKLSGVKDKVIHHLSHELKTPVSVLSASLSLLKKKFMAELQENDKEKCEKIFRRAERNLQRLLKMQYEIEDIIRDKNYNAFHLLNNLLFACTDQLEVFITEEMGGGEILNRIRRRIDEIFGPRKSVSKKVKLNKFVSDALRIIGFRFTHREECRIIKNFSDVPLINIPEDVLLKIIEGLIKNAVENTPDKGKIVVTVEESEPYVKFEVKDFGVGISRENIALIFENYFTTYETADYSTKREYDFGAGGKGFDLLRMKIFSEQYGFKIDMESERCPYIEKNKIVCPGNIDKCRFCVKHSDCFESGGTAMRLFFPCL